jgi:hypothetical protein
MQNPDRLLLQAVDEYGVTRVSYTLTTEISHPTPTPTPAPPFIVQQPKPAKVPVGQTATFSVFATGTAPITYQWKKNGANIPGATNNFYVTPPVTRHDNHSSFTVKITNPYGSVLSRPAPLSVQP